jgi:DNA-binding FrmR family transcriptional regulator
MARGERTARAGRRGEPGESGAASAAIDGTELCGCGCAAGAESDGDRKAVAVDPDIKERNRKRLRRIEGQVRGLQKMVDDDRYCADILTQISSVHEALRAVGRELMRNHLKHCAASALQGSEAEAEAMYDELVEMMYKHSR